MADIGLQNSLGNFFSPSPILIAGPCSAENRNQVLQTAKALSQIGVKIFRAGVWKPRTKPGGFEGVGEIGLQWLSDVRSLTGMQVCTEVATGEHLRLALKAGIEVFWIGARTTADPFAVQSIADTFSTTLAASAPTSIAEALDATLTGALTAPEAALSTAASAAPSASASTSIAEALDATLTGASTAPEAALSTAASATPSASAPTSIAEALDATLTGASTVPEAALSTAATSTPTTLCCCSMDRIVVLVKNPVNPDVELWAGAVERFRNAGVKNIILVHRGFSTYDNGIYRNAPLWHIPIEMKRRYPDIPLLCDPSHMGGKRNLVQPLCQQALDLNYDGLMIESHINPAAALSDKDQQLTPAELKQVLSGLELRNNLRQDTLESYRRRLDELDENMLHLLSQRMELSRQIGEYKMQHNMPVLQSKRYGEIVESFSEEADRLGLSKEFARQLMELIHKESIRIQMKDRPLSNS